MNFTCLAVSHMKTQSVTALITLPHSLLLGGREIRKLILTFPPLHIVELHAPYHLVLYFE